MKAYLERGEIERLSDAAKCLRDKLLVLLLSRLGCRVSEALALAVDEIDFRQGTVTIESTSSYVSGWSAPVAAPVSEKVTHTAPSVGKWLIRQ